MSNHFAVGGSCEVHGLCGLAGSFHLLHDAARREAVLLDTGLAGEMPRLRALLLRLGLGWRDIRAILLTHGHLDHTGNLATLKALTGAPLLAHPLEQAHIDGTFPYEGPSRLCGLMEAAGRRLLRYRPVAIDEPLAPDGELPFWGGLRVVHLPGHTAGHCGFHSTRFDLLFSGDLFASYGFSTHLPPPFLNSRPGLLAGSLRRVRDLSPRGLVPNHYDILDPARHRRHFDALCRRIPV